MAQPVVVASPGTQITNKGVQVTDGTNVRVTVGQINSSVPGDYGLKVLSSDGTTVIIDGTSDMWKIVAKGTDSFTIAGVATTTSPANNVTHVTTLTGLGTFAVQQAFLGYVAFGTSSTSAVTLGSLGGTGGGGNHFVSTVNTGFTAVSEGGNDMFTGFWQGSLDNTAPAFQDIFFAGSNWLTSSVSANGRWYVMSEAAL
jgi:hypothetical protein